MPRPKSYLPPLASITLSTNYTGSEIVEIAVPLSKDMIDLGYPRLSGKIKRVNETWSVKFIIDFLLLEKPDGDFVFEAETVAINRNQFLSRNSLVNRLEQIYLEYYDKLLCCNFDADTDMLIQIKEYFDGTLSLLKVVDTDTVFLLSEH